MLRESALRDWLAAFGLTAERLEPLAGDVSARRYFRAHRPDGESVVVALYPESLADACRRFVASGELLAAAGIRVPRVVAVDCARGAMAVEDLGPATLFERSDLAAGELSAYLEAAAETAARIATLPRAEVAGLNPPLDRTLLRRELEIATREALAPRGLLADRSPGSELAAAFDGALDSLCDRLAADPPVPCHRDFMIRNLVPTGPAPGLAVIDHQDLRLGPPLYDLASLLEDSVEPPAGLAARLRERWAPGRTDAYHRTAAQRTLKAAGTFARFARRGNPRHLPILPATLLRALEHLLRLPEMEPVAERLEALWRPALANLRR